MAGKKSRPSIRRQPIKSSRQKRAPRTAPDADHRMDVEDVDPELVSLVGELVIAWPTLSDPVKASIRAMLRMG